GCEPKESPVLYDGTADTATEEIVRIVRFRNARFLTEEVVFLGPNGTSLEEAGAMKVVGPRFQRRVKHATTGPPHFGIVGMHLDRHVLESFNARICGRPVAEVGNWNAVERVVISPACTATQRQ